MNETTEAAAASSEWLFKTDGQVFGPISEERLVELVVAGKVDAGTEVASADGAWRTIGSLARFRVPLKKAEVKARVEEEITSSRRIARRRSAVHLMTAITGVIVAIALAGGAATYLAIRRPWERRSKLLEGFGDGIEMSAVRVGGGPRAEVDDAGVEIAIPSQVDPRQQPAAPRAKRALAASRPAPGSGAPVPARAGDLVLARYDPNRIQAVVSARRGSLAPCVREEARRSPEFAGEIPIEFAVGNDGKVAALWIDEPRFKSGPLRDCLLQRLREWSFDPFPGQRPIVSLAFRIESR